MNENELDLSVFPIVRLDHLPLLPEDLLEKAIFEIEEMISNEENGSKMSTYLMKQLNAMKVEEAKRLAEKRINDILTGKSSIDILNPSRYDNIFLDKPLSKNESSNTIINKSNNSNFANNESDLKPKFLNDLNKSKINNNESSDVISITPIRKKSRRLSGSSQSDIFKSPPRPPSPLSKSKSTSQSIQDSPTSSIISSISEPPVNSNVTVRLANPSFGIEFVVSATERKRRRPIQKKIEETPEQIKEKEKNQRRQEAIKRLMKRREEQAEAQRKLKEKQRILRCKKLEKEQKEKSLEKGGIFEDEKTSVIESEVDTSLIKKSSTTISSPMQGSLSQPIKTTSTIQVSINPTNDKSNQSSKFDNINIVEDSTNKIDESNDILEQNFNNIDDQDDELNELEEEIETDNVISTIPLILDEDLIEAAKENLIEIESKYDNLENQSSEVIICLAEDKKDMNSISEKCNHDNISGDSESISPFKKLNPLIKVENDAEMKNNDNLDGKRETNKNEEYKYKILKNNGVDINELINNDVDNNTIVDNTVDNNDVDNIDVDNNDVDNIDVDNNDVDNIDVDNNDVDNNYVDYNDVNKIDVNKNDIDKNVKMKIIAKETENNEVKNHNECFKYDTIAIENNLIQPNNDFNITNLDQLEYEEKSIEEFGNGQIDLSSLSINSNDSPRLLINDNFVDSIPEKLTSIEEKPSFEILKNKGVISNISKPNSEKSQRPRNSSQAMQKPLTSMKNTPTNVNNIKLSDFYSNIRQIFTCTYINSTSQSGNQNNSDYIARTLIEAIQFQINLYEEWIEIMRDYATVYCLEDGDYEDCSEAKVKSSQVYPGSPSTLHYSINSSSHNEVFNIVNDAFEERIHPQLLSITNSTNSLKKKWVALPSGLGLGPSWNLLWTWSRPRGLLPQRLLIWQKTNHFQHSGQLTRKDLLKKNLEYLCGKVNNNVDLINRKEFDIMPLTFLLPQEYSAFVQSFVASSRQNKDEINQEKCEKNIWILKPIGLSRGRGISLVQSLDELKFSQASVIQKYVENPLCLNGYKFDLRLYVLVTSFHPLEAFIFTDGFARVSTEKFSLSSSDISNKFIHLTNSSIQKHQKQEMMKDNPLNDDKKFSNNTSEINLEDEIDSDVGGTKIGLLGKKGLWSRLLEMDKNINIDQIWKSIKILVLKSLIAVDDKIPYQPSSFELFGYDVLIDDNLKPWLIEVNASPSLARENLLDNKVKDACIRDIIKLVNPAPYNRQELIRVLKKRLNDIRKQKINPIKKKENKEGITTFDQELEDDLRAILNYNDQSNSDPYIPRRYGEPPSYLGGFEPLAPNTKEFDHVVKLKRKLYKPVEYDLNLATI